MKAVVVLLALSVFVYNVKALPTSEESDEVSNNKPAITETRRFSRPLLCNFRCHLRCFFRGYWTGYCKTNSCMCAGNRNPDADSGSGNNNPGLTDAPDVNDPINEGNEETNPPPSLPGFPTQPPVSI